MLQEIFRKHSLSLITLSVLIAFSCNQPSKSNKITTTDLIGIWINQDTSDLFKFNFIDSDYLIMAAFDKTEKKWTGDSQKLLYTLTTKNNETLLIIKFLGENDSDSACFFLRKIDWLTIKSQAYNSKSEIMSDKGWLPETKSNTKVLEKNRY